MSFTKGCIANSMYLIQLMHVLVIVVPLISSKIDHIIQISCSQINLIYSDLTRQRTQHLGVYMFHSVACCKILHKGRMVNIQLYKYSRKRSLAQMAVHRYIYCVVYSVFSESCPLGSKSPCVFQRMSNMNTTTTLVHDTLFAGSVFFQCLNDNRICYNIVQRPSVVEVENCG